MAKATPPYLTGESVTIIGRHVEIGGKRVGKGAALQVLAHVTASGKGLHERELYREHP